jgi:hypothetical protein
MSKHQGAGFGYVGAVNYTPGYKLGKEIINRYAFGEGIGRWSGGCSRSQAAANAPKE